MAGDAPDDDARDRPRGASTPATCHLPLLARPARRPARLRGAHRAERARRGHRDRPRLHGPASGRGGAAAVAGADRRSDRRGAATARARPARRRAAAARLASLALRLLRSGLGPPDGTNDEAIAAADAAAAELKVAIQELRELARGIHPAILTEAGLGPAITPSPTAPRSPPSVTSLPDRRLPEAVEATAYFVVSEALANVAKYASATRATVGADCRGDTLQVEVGDDGVGGADASRGSGIRGLQDRVAALGGRLTVESPIGADARHRGDPDRPRARGCGPGRP